MQEVTLTTSDNPWNPFTEVDEWLIWDHEKGYDTLEYLARLTPDSNILPVSVRSEIIEDYIDEIVAFDLIGKETGGEVHYVKAIAPG